MSQARQYEELPAPESHWRPLALLGPVVALFLMGLTFLFWQAADREVEAKKRQAFTASADRIVDSLKDRMATFELVLRGVKGYYDGSDSIDRNEFHAYVQALRLSETRPGLQGVSYALDLPADRLDAHMAQMRARGFSFYTVHPAGVRARYTPLTHIEPQSIDNLKALGFDISTVPAAREALDRARDTGQLALTARLRLQQDIGRNSVSGLVMYLPIYQKDADLDSVEGRRRGVVGWVSAPFRVPELLQGLAQQLDADIDLAIYDGNPEAGGTLLHGNTNLPTAPEGVSNGLRATQQMHLGGRTWTLVMQPLPAFTRRFDDTDNGLFAAMGAALSLLVGGLIWVMATGRERAVGLAHRMTQALRSTRDDLESTLNAIPDLLFEVGLDGRIHHCRAARSVLLAAPPEMFLGRLMDEFVPPEAIAGWRAALQAAHDTGHSIGHQYRLELGQKTHWFELSIARKESATPGQIPRFIALSRDITERKLAEARTHQLAYFDALTGLPNRRMLLDRLEHALASAHNSGQVGALLFIDLDNFKQINDARGHPLGDVLLKQVAQRLTQLQRPGDTVARIGGDEFVLLVNDIATDMESAGRGALLAAEAVRAALEAPYTIETHLYSSTGSIGITLFPKRSEEVEDLLREADTAMYRAKDLGRNRIRFYEADMQADVQERLALEQDLKKASADGQLTAFVQSQVDASGTVIGGELLMRWNHPVRGSVPPSRFIPVAESSGLILRMGDWMIRQACETLARLHAVGQDLSISVNVSERQFRQDDFVERVRDMLAQTGAPAAQLILEVTESLLIENLDDTIARMTELGQSGVRFSIDDFGTGYSSLAYLKRLPLYELKIDKSFVQDTPDDPSDTAIVQSIISVARHLKLRVVAEGVETRAQADFLVASHCDCLQGYLFSRPEPLQGWVERQLGAG
ncbi:EAL domain-containing protein [Acidovorax sp. JG5]|uniref:bifunctional diguanylate cyclase/phosphodiesterase n=1 Tax=Acidovorax sp. JG5 TaxID=2822718 RepID=UPI001B33E2E6|nr:EAL domain-containing protein [Acidovorax sp. JG5]MBP3981434.1 EAL domain-containing protein [Acidovorax sp. JG5]